MILCTAVVMLKKVFKEELPSWLYKDKMSSEGFKVGYFLKMIKSLPLKVIVQYAFTSNSFLVALST